jgi:protein-disulfide isomerase
MAGMARKVDIPTLGLALAGVLALGLMVAFPQSSPKAAAKKHAAARHAAPAVGPNSGLNKQHLEAYVRHLYGWMPDVKVEVGDFTPSPVPGLLQTTVHATYQLASEQKVFYVSKDGKHILDGNIYPADDNPFRDNLKKITTSLEPSFGAAGAPVVLVSYSDFECPHCRDEAKLLRENLAKTYPTQVRYYFKDYPLPMHDWAMTASLAGRCIFRQNPQTFWQYHDWVFDKQGEITATNFRDKLGEFIKGKPIDPLQLSRCLDQKQTEGEVEKSMAEAKSLGVTSTPTLFLNGRRILGATPWPQLKQIIDLELDYQKTAANAAEQECCEVKLPSPIPK